MFIVAVNVRIYQWQVNGTDMHESSKHTGARTSTLTIHNIQEQDEGVYSCIIGNEFLTNTSELAALTVCKSGETRQGMGYVE